VGAVSGAVQRELSKLVESGLVTVSRKGQQKHYQANAESPIYPELHALIRKTVGLAEPLRAALDPLKERIVLALVYGSVAKGSQTASSDVDLLIVSDALTLERLYEALAVAETALGRAIHPTLYTSAEYEHRVQTANPFLQRVLAGDIIVLLGTVES